MLMKSKVQVAVAALIAFSGAAHALDVPAFPAPGISSPGSPNFQAANFSASLTKDGSDYTLSIFGSDPNIGVFNVGSGSYLVGNEEVELTAHFDSTGHLLTNMSNTIEIEGSVQAWSSPTFGTAPAGFSWSAQPKETLFAADITGVGVDWSNEALGFSITNFSGWVNQKQFTTGGAESLWLFSNLTSPPQQQGDDEDGDEGDHEHGHRGHHHADNSPSSADNLTNWDTFLAEIKNHSKLKTNTFYGVSSVTTVPLPAAALLLGSGLLGLGALRRRRGNTHPATA